MIGRMRSRLLRSGWLLRVVFFSLFLAPLLLVRPFPRLDEPIASWSWVGALTPLGRERTGRDGEPFRLRSYSTRALRVRLCGAVGPHRVTTDGRVAVIMTTPV